jgi:hypothetical protein
VWDPAERRAFARLALQLEDDSVVGHRTRRVAYLAADEADLTEDAAGWQLGKELLAAAHAHGHVNAAADAGFFIGRSLPAPNTAGRVRCVLRRAAD